MEQWYALYTVPGREQDAAELLERVVSHNLWSDCRIPRKVKVFRSGGVLHLLEHYRDRIVKLNLHKRFAVVEVELFNRTQAVLFGVSLEQDRAV